MGQIKAVLFDYDGTLMDTNDIILESWQHTFRRLTGEECPEEKLYPTFGEPLRDTMKAFFPEEDTDACVAIYREYQSDFYHKEIRMFPGMKELIFELKQKGYLTALVTSRAPGSTAEGLKKYGLTDAFDAVVTCGDTDKHKPDPEPIFICTRKLCIEPREAMMVGDTTFDILCGKRAGTKTVLAGWSVAYTEEQKIAEETKPDYIIQKAADLLQILGTK